MPLFFRLSVSRMAIASLGLVAASAQAQTRTGAMSNVSTNPRNPDFVAFELREGDERHEIQIYRHSTGTSVGVRAAAVVGGGGIVLPGLGSSRTVKAYSSDLDWGPVVDGGRQWFSYMNGEDGRIRIRLNFIGSDGKVGVAPPRALPGNPVASYARWSPNGKHLAFLSDSSALYVIWGAYRLLQDNPPGDVTATRVGQVRGAVYFPAWSPTGEYLAYQAERVVGGQRRYAVEAVAVDTLANAVLGTPITLSERLTVENAYRPSWSPDGKYVAIYMDRGGAAEMTGVLDIGILQPVVNANTGRIFSADVKEGGSRTRRLAEGVISNDTRGPTWARLEGETESGGMAPLLGLLFAESDVAKGNPITFAALDRWLARRPRDVSHLNISSGLGTTNHKSIAFVEDASRLRFAFAVTMSAGDSLRVREIPAAWARRPVYAILSLPKDGTVAATNPPPPTGKRGGSGLSKAFLFPGAGQFSSGRKVRGSLYAIVAIAGGALVFSGNAAQSAPVAAAEAAAAYNVRDTTAHNDAQTALDKAQTKMMNGAIAFGAMYALGIIDAKISGGKQLAIFARPRPNGHGRYGTAAHLSINVPVGGPRR